MGKSTRFRAEHEIAHAHRGIETCHAIACSLLLYGRRVNAVRQHLLLCEPSQFNDFACVTAQGVQRRQSPPEHRLSRRTCAHR